VSGDQLETGWLGPRVSDLLREAAEWRLIGLLFERPRGDWWAQVASLARICAEPDLRAASAQTQEATEGVFLAILGPGGTASPREVAYRKAADPGQVLSDLQAFYRAFAFEPATEEPPDHVSVEAGFVGYLRLKEAYAVARNDAESARITAEAASRFLDEHLSTYAGPLARALKGARVEYLAQTAKGLHLRAGERQTEPQTGWSPHGPENCALTCGDQP
jgi:nitrate reductase assembly molybdenum cofactor insertion protein NarJ